MTATKSSLTMMDATDEPADAPGWIVHLDSRITRRKTFHFVADPKGAIVCRSRLMSDIFDFLDDWGVVEYKVDGDFGLYEVQSRRVSKRERVS